MTTDAYTKIILTVIAVSLAVIAFREVVAPTAKAQSQMHVVIDSVASSAFQYAGPLEVRGR
jgi:hypothetical protein